MSSQPITLKSRGTVTCLPSNPWQIPCASTSSKAIQALAPTANNSSTTLTPDENDAVLADTTVSSIFRAFVAFSTDICLCSLVGNGSPAKVDSRKGVQALVRLKCRFLDEETKQWRTHVCVDPNTNVAAKSSSRPSSLRMAPSPSAGSRGSGPGPTAGPLQRR